MVLSFRRHFVISALGDLDPAAEWVGGKKAVPHGPNRALENHAMTSHSIVNMPVYVCVCECLFMWTQDKAEYGVGLWTVLHNNTSNPTAPWGVWFTSRAVTEDIQELRPT